MTIDVKIQDAKTGETCLVTSRGQLVVSPISYSVSYTTSVTVINTAYNLVPARADKKFVITDIILTGDKTISTVTDATVDIYEASGPDETTIDNELIQVDVPRSQSVILIGLNLITENAAKYINVKSTDINVKTVLMGYYVYE